MGQDGWAAVLVGRGLPRQRAPREDQRVEDGRSGREVTEPENGALNG